MSSNLYSIIVPIFNTESYIEQCIDSLLTQRYEKFEAIFVDDGSNDSSSNIVDRYTKVDGRIKLIKQTNQGAAAARNTGLLYAKGDYVLFLDSDDWLDIRALEKIDAVLSKQPVDLLLYGYKWVASASEGRNSSLDKLDKLTSGQSSTIKDFREELVNTFTGIAGKVIKRSELERKSLRIPRDIRNAEDTVFYLSLLVNLDSFVILNDELYCYRHPVGRLTLTSTGNVRDIAKACDCAIEKFGNVIGRDIIIGRFLTTLFYTYNFPGSIKKFADLQIIKKYADAVLASDRKVTINEKRIKDFLRYEFSIKGFLHRLIQVKFLGQIRDIYFCGLTIHLPRIKTILLKRKIESYQKTVLERIKNKLKKHDKLKVVFLVNELAKFKVAELLKLMNKDARYETLVVIAPLSGSYISQRSALKDIQNYFESKGINYALGYDENTGETIDLRTFNPDLVFYQQPWAQRSNHQIQNVIKYSLAYYVPYYVPNYGNTRYDCRQFHKYLFRYYVFNQEYADIFKTILFPFTKALKPVGHPVIDEVLSAERVVSKKKTVIYAPHFSLGKGEIGYGTFMWSGFLVLEFAKKHPEFHWVFKPHPRLSRELVNKQFMSKENVEKYYADWAKIGTVYEGPDYKSLFKTSHCMITDCGSFLMEYFFTGNPLIHLVSGFAHQPCYPLKKVLNNYYEVYSYSELEEIMEDVLLKHIDAKRNIRETNLKRFQQFYPKTASLQIMEDMNATFFDTNVSE